MVTCKCRKFAIDPTCPRHGIGSKRYLANLAGLVCVVFVTLLAIFTAPAKSEERPVPLIICDVFGRYCDQALRVSWCESRWQPAAKNGQYRGLFQVSAHWREAIAGWGPSAAAQAVHAFRVFQRTGRDWDAWSCQP